MENIRKDKRNTLLELFRLFASLWVMYYHGYSLITKTNMFNNGRIAVDFFFILSGYFFLSSYKKEENKPLLKGVLSFVYKRFKPLAITFLICFVPTLIYYIQFFEGVFESNLWGYLWYIPTLMVMFASFFILRRLIKSNKWFYITVGIISTVGYLLILTYFCENGYARGFAGVGLGILLSSIPKLNFKNSNLVSWIISILLFGIILFITIISPVKQIEDPLCLLFLFPSLIYFVSNVNFNCHIINEVCSINFGLYCYQAFTRILEINNIVSDTKILFLIVLGLSLIDLIIKLIIKKKKEGKVYEKTSI